MNNGILLLTETPFKLLKKKNPQNAPPTEGVLLSDQSESIHQIKYENINADAVYKAVLKAKGDLGLWRWMQMVGNGF